MNKFEINWLEQLSQFNRLIVGFSGGLDSTVLLHNLAQFPALHDRLLAIHINHGISANAKNWQYGCQRFCDGLGIPFLVKEVEFLRQANLEEEARKARYKAFASELAPGDCLILAHHLDDQAETLLLQLFRGTGVDGLAAMVASKEFAKGKLLRPLLEYSRQNLEDYAKFHQLQWHDDESNQNTAYSRNFLRQQIFPLLRTRWPKIANNLARTTHHCQQAQANLEDLAKIDCPELNKATTTLTLTSLSHLSYPRMVNVLRFWFKSNNIKSPSTLVFNQLIDDLIKTKPHANPEVTWKGVSVKRYQQNLYLGKTETKLDLTTLAWPSFPEPLMIEGVGQLMVEKAEQGFVLPAPSQLEIRFRQGGELFKWHGQVKQLKKLMQEWQIPPWLRESVPLLYVDGQLAVVVGYAIADPFYREMKEGISPMRFVLMPTFYANSIG